MAKDITTVKHKTRIELLEKNPKTHEIFIR